MVNSRPGGALSGLENDVPDAAPDVAREPLVPHARPSLPDGLAQPQLDTLQIVGHLGRTFACVRTWPPDPFRPAMVRTGIVRDLLDDSVKVHTVRWRTDDAGLGVVSTLPRFAHGSELHCAARRIERQGSVWSMGGPLRRCRRVLPTTLARIAGRILATRRGTVHPPLRCNAAMAAGAARGCVWRAGTVVTRAGCPDPRAGTGRDRAS